MNLREKVGEIVADTAFKVAEAIMNDTVMDATDRILALFERTAVEREREAFVECAKWIDSGEGLEAKAMLAGGAEAEATRRYQLPKEDIRA